MKISTSSKIDLCLIQNDQDGTILPRLAKFFTENSHVGVIPGKMPIRCLPCTYTYQFLVRIIRDPNTRFCTTIEPVLLYIRLALPYWGYRTLHYLLILYVYVITSYMAINYLFQTHLSFFARYPCIVKIPSRSIVWYGPILFVVEK